MENQDEKQSFEFVEDVAKSILNVHLVNLEGLMQFKMNIRKKKEYSNNAYETIKKIVFNNKDLLDNYNKFCISSNENIGNLFNHLFFYREKHINEDQEIYEKKKKKKTDSNDNLEITVSEEFPNIPESIILNETEKDKIHYFTPKLFQDRIQNQTNEISAKFSISKNLSYLNSNLVKTIMLKNINLIFHFINGCSHSIISSKTT